MTITYRTHRPGDAAALSALTAVATPQDAVATDWFTENVLLDPGFHPEGLVIAEGEAGPVGFVYAVAAPDAAEQTTGGWLTIGGVHPDHRGHGVGTELLERALAHLRHQGAAWANVSAYPPAYFVPGLDARAYPQAAELLAARGFRRLYIASAMALELSTYRMPDQVRLLARERSAQGYWIGAATPDDLPGVLELARREFAADWAQAVREAVLRHGRVDRVRIVKDAAGTIVAFAIYGAYRGLRERFGPFGVRQSLRGTGLGKVLLHDALTAMRAEGAQSAWFLWTDEDSPAGHLYRRTGFEVTRRFEVQRLTLNS